MAFARKRNSNTAATVALSLGEPADRLAEHASQGHRDTPTQSLHLRKRDGPVSTGTVCTFR